MWHYYIYRQISVYIITKIKTFNWANKKLNLIRYSNINNIPKKKQKKKKIKTGRTNIDYREWKKFVF
jgi:hypothetical protein